MSHNKRSSGQPKQKWTVEEEQALRLGVKSYGVGKWRLIQKDDACGPVLANRSNVDLKDKWRNLNMEARESSNTAADTDDDPDFKKEASKHKRKRRRSSKGTASSRHDHIQADEVLAPDLPPEEMSRPLPEATEGEEVVSSPQEPHQEWPPPGPLDMALPNSHDSPDISPNSKGGPIVDDMVVAAVISLQDPVGSGADDICTWIEDHYPAVDREKVKVVMTHMVQAGRLQHVPNCPGLVRMGGVVRQLADQEALPMHLHDDALDHADEDLQEAVIDQKIVAEHAMLAAQAVAEAEETSRKAGHLLDAANAVEELDHSLQDRPTSDR